MRDFAAGRAASLPDFAAGRAASLPDFAAGRAASLPDFAAGRAASLPDFVAGRAARLCCLTPRGGLLGACFSTGSRLTSMLRRAGLKPLTTSASCSPIFT